MPFKSKAQQRFMFSQHPRMAKRWANETPNIKKLPEKLHPEDTVKKTASEGLFFEKRAKAAKGRFFRDMPGREEGNFHKQSMMGGGAINIAPTGAPMTGAGGGGAGLGALYGTGEGEKKDKEKSPTERLKERLRPEEKPASEEKESEKQAAYAPSDWESGGSPTGQHRPTKSQPAALEAGGERFHSLDSLPPEGEDTGPSKGTVEGGRMKNRSSDSQMGKHASAAPPRFLGTSFAKHGGAMDTARRLTSNWKSDLGQGLGEAGTDLSKGVDELGTWTKNTASTANKKFREGLRHPAGAAAVLGLGGLAGLGVLGRAGRAVSRIAGLGRKPAAPVGAAANLKKMLLG